MAAVATTALLADDGAVETTALTRLELHPCPPSYAAPEQLRGGVIEDLADRDRLEDEANDPHLAPALTTDQRVDLVDPADQAGPTTPLRGAVPPSGAPPFGGVRLLVARARSAGCVGEPS